MLIVFCGLVCSLCAWEQAEEWLAEQYAQLEARCQ